MRWSDFTINQTDQIRWLSFSALNAYDFILHGLVIKSQNPLLIQKQREIKRFLQTIASSKRSLISPYQMHQDECLILTSKDKPKRRYRGDAILTERHDVFISVNVADCVPIFLVNEKRKVIGLIHAGWKGTLLGIVKMTLKKAECELGCESEDFTILLGPCIQSCCYQVSEDVAVLLDKECIHRTKKGNPALDLICMLRKQFLSCEVKEERIFATDVCTCCDDDLFYSYRREKENAGRMIAFLGLK